jgi:hypothetical protein
MTGAGTYKTYDGLMVSIPAGKSLETTREKLDQLSGLVFLMKRGEPSSDTHEAQVIASLAYSLVLELEQLLPIVCAEAAKGGSND